MKNATPLLAACALLLSASAFSQNQPNCDKSCTVVVTLQAGCGSGIRVSLDPINVTRGAAPEITWVVQPDNSPWYFDAKGIEFIRPEGTPAPPFEKKAQGSNKSFVMKHVNKQAGIYKYNVNLVRDLPDNKTKESCKLDPTVVNW